MTTEEIVRYGLSFLGGGFVSGLLAWIREASLARRREETERHRTQQRAEADRLEQQLKALYGPLHFFVTQAAELFNLANRIHGAYNVEYVGRPWSQEQGTQEALRRETAVTYI